CAPMFEMSNDAPELVNPPLLPAGGVSCTLTSIVTMAPFAYWLDSAPEMAPAACIALFQATAPAPGAVASRHPETTPPALTLHTMLPRVPAGMSEPITATRTADAIEPASGASRPSSLSFLAICSRTTLPAMSLSTGRGAGATVGAGADAWVP